MTRIRIRIRILLTLIPFIGSLAGCEVVRGLERKAPFAGAPDFACMATAVRSVDGVAEVQASPADSLTYRIAGIQGDAERRPAQARIYLVRYRTGPRLFHTFMLMNQTPPLADMDVARPTMVKVEKAIGTQCPFSPDPDSYRETCKARRCTAGA